MRTQIILKFIFSSVLMLPGLSTAAAEVKDTSFVGFTIQDTVVIAADPHSVYRSLVTEIGSWWDSAHTFSGKASNLSIDDTAGGCFCEKLEHGGSVRHLEVVFADPGKTLRMIGGLGPLQAMAVAGSMTWSLAQRGTGTNVTVTYTIGGFRPGGLQKMALLVDKVMLEQLKRLKEYIEHKMNGK